MESKSTHAALLAHLSEHLPQMQQAPDSVKEEAADSEAADLKAAEKKAKDSGKAKKNGKSESKKGKKGKKSGKKADADKAGKKASKKASKNTKQEASARTADGSASAADTKLNCENSPYYDQEQLGEMLALVDAAGSFIHAGNAIQLQDFFRSVYGGQECGSAQQAVTESIGALVAFSDVVALCDIEHLGPAAMTVSAALDRIEAIAPEDADLYIEMLKALVPDIRRKMYTDQWTDAASVYPAVIRWAAENRLLQQAVNLYIEKMPIVYMADDSKVRGWIPKTVEFPSSDPVDKFATDLYIGVSKMDGSVDKVRVFRRCVSNVCEAYQPGTAPGAVPGLIGQEIAAVAEKGRISESRNDQIAYAKLETGLMNLREYVQNELSGKGWGRIYGTQQNFESLREFFELVSEDARLSRYFLFDYGAPHEVIRNTDPGTFTSKVESLLTMEKAIQKMADADDYMNEAKVASLEKLLRLMQHYMAMRLTRRLMSQDKDSISSMNKDQLADQRIAYGYLQDAGIPVDAEVDKIVKIILDGLQISE